MVLSRRDLHVGQRYAANGGYTHEITDIDETYGVTYVCVDGPDDTKIGRGGRVEKTEFLSRVIRLIPATRAVLDDTLPQVGEVE